MAEPQPARVADRLAFLLALVPYILENEQVSVAQAAAHFDVTEEHVRDAVRLITVSGIPGESRQYQHNDLFDIDWDAFDDDLLVITNTVVIDDAPRLSAREAAALIAGLQYLSALPENADRTAIASLTAKLTRGAVSMPSPLAVDDGAEPPALPEIRRAIDSGLVLRFGYLNGRDVQEARTVEPLRVESIDDSWYLRGWDQTRSALRTFRLDRMSEVRADPSAPLAGRRAEVELPDRIFQPTTDDQEVVLEVVDGAVALLDDYTGGRPAVSPGSAGTVRVTLRIAHMSGLKRLVAAHAGLMRVVEPGAAREAVAAWATAGAAQYEEPDRADSV